MSVRVIYEDVAVGAADAAHMSSTAAQHSAITQREVI